MNEIDPQQGREDEAILAAMAVLGNEAAEVPRAEIRPWVELLGLLPYELELESPPTRLKSSLMSEISRRPSGGNTKPFEVREKVARVSSIGWVVRIAAMLAVALLGLSVKQASDLAESSRQIDGQEIRIAELREQLGEIRSAGHVLPEWMTASGTELCQLRPQVAEAAGSNGWLFVRKNRQHWHVAVEGLAATPEGHIYEIWFMVDGQSVSGGTFGPDADGNVALSAETMPTGVTGVAITLEPLNGDATPSDTRMLYGDEVMLTL